MVFVFGVDFPLMELMFVYIVLILLSSVLMLIEFASLKKFKQSLDYDFKKLIREIKEIKKILKRFK